jgi:two-component system, OmpR family, KDP operon response regulator KdpE
MEQKSEKPCVLVIDDEKAILRLAHTTLEAGGFRVVEANNGLDGITEAANSRPDVILLDLNMPEMNGLEVLKRLREWYAQSIVILSVVNDEQTIVNALDLGADDYLTKPFGAKELLARIRVCLRHQHFGISDSLFTSGDLHVSLSTREVSFKGERIRLTVTEYDVLRMLVLHAGRAATHRQIMTAVWGPYGANQVSNLRVIIARLRQKIEQDPDRPRILLTESGVGYRLEIVEP